MPPEDPGSFEERVLRRIPLEIAVLAAALAVPAAFLFGPAAGFLFLAGGAFSALGFAGLRQSLDRFLSRGRKGAMRAGIILYVLRLVLICAVFFLIILLYPKKILAFVAGFSVVVPVSFVEGVRALLLLRKWKD